MSSKIRSMAKKISGKQLQVKMAVVDPDGRVTRSVLSAAEYLKRYDPSTFVYVNVRLGNQNGQPLTFPFSPEGRLDSFTTACSTLEEAEARLGYPFSRESDHAFLYVKEVDAEPAPLDGYALMIVGEQLYWTGGKSNEARNVECISTEIVSASDLLQFLAGGYAYVKDDTVFEQMRWVQAAQSHGLLSADYPAFDVAMECPNGISGRWKPVLKGAKVSKNEIIVPLRT